MSGNEVWNAYIDQFDYFSRDGIREGCEPRIISTGRKERDAVVLVHGLTDSPYYMGAIGERLHGMGFNVLIPLLQCHGLRQPNGMRGVSLAEWKRNVTYALEQATTLGDRVSVGGLSTGGALSVHAALQDEAPVNGAVFLFSAALDIGYFKEKSAAVLAKWLDLYDDWCGSPLIGDDPYRYARMDKGGAKELVKLIGEIDRLTGSRGKKQRLTQPVFAAHSEYDSTADIEGIEDLLDDAESDMAMLFRIGKDFQVPHASVVLEEDVRARNGSPLEPRNPFFDDMMSSLQGFVGRHLGPAASA